MYADQACTCATVYGTYKFQQVAVESEGEKGM